MLTAPPTAAVRYAYGIDVTPDFLLKMQRAAVRFQTDGSGSIVSAKGLVMTNHHVGSDMLLKLSTQANNLLKDGFIARTNDAELKCPDLELNVLWEIKDVTADVFAAVKPEMSAAEAGNARRMAIAHIEASVGKSTKDSKALNGEVIGLIFDGNFYSLVANVAYDGRTNRAVAVDVRGMARLSRPCTTRPNC